MVLEQEEERLRALRRAALLHTSPEEEFDRLIKLAANILRAPVAMVEPTRRAANAPPGSGCAGSGGRETAWRHRG
jgi:hypothetical protein